MDTKHNDDTLKTRGKIKKGEHRQPPATPQPKKQELKLTYNDIKNFCKKFNLDEKLIIENKEPLRLTTIGIILFIYAATKITEAALKIIKYQSQ